MQTNWSERSLIRRFKDILKIKKKYQQTDGVCKKIESNAKGKILFWGAVVVADLGASVIARLKRRADQDGLQLQLLLNLFCQEDFLRRIQKSRYCNNLILEVIAEDKQYNGIRVNLVGLINKTRTPFSVDFGIGDVVVPPPRKKKLPVLFPDFEQPEVFTYSLEY